MPNVDELRSELTGTVRTPDDPGYAGTVTGWGPPLSPDVIVQPADTTDVAAALAWAAQHRVDVGVRSGGHGAWAPLPGGILIDMAAFDAIDVDGDVVRIGAGNTWGAVADALASHHLVISAGDAASVGVAGNALGAGVGWMLRRVGLAVDQLVGAEMVAVDGRVVYASPTENTDLFWALRGGGGNFGVVTRLDFRAAEVPAVVFGTAEIDTSQLAGILTGVRDAMRDAPRDLVVVAYIWPPMPGAPAPALKAMWAGDDLDAARAAVAPIAEIEGVGAFELNVVPYRDTVQDPMQPPGAPPRMAGGNGVFTTLSDATAERAAAALSRHPMSLFDVRYLGGAFADVAPDATALHWRDAEALVHWIAMVPPDASDDQLAAAEAVWAPVGEGADAVVGTFVDGVDDAWVVRMYPPDTLHRLREVKTAWDPGNVLHRNHNIRPL